MRIREIQSLISSFDEDSQWDSLIEDDTSELYLEKGLQYTVRIVGPTYKALRCYISRNNAIARKLTLSQFRETLNGEVKHYEEIKYLDRASHKNTSEFEVATNKTMWNNCLLATVILEESRQRKLNHNLYYVAIPKPAVRDILKALKEKPDSCISGLKASSIILNKSALITTAQLTEERMLDECSLRTIVRDGIKDAKEFYSKLNKNNLYRKSGFFYSFVKEKDKSVLDKGQ